MNQNCQGNTWRWHCCGRERCRGPGNTSNFPHRAAVIGPTQAQGVCSEDPLDPCDDISSIGPARCINQLMNGMYVTCMPHQQQQCSSTTSVLVSRRISQQSINKIPVCQDLCPTTTLSCGASSLASANCWFSVTACSATESLEAGVADHQQLASIFLMHALSATGHCCKLSRVSLLIDLHIEINRRSCRGR